MNDLSEVNQVIVVGIQRGASWICHWFADLELRREWLVNRNHRRSLWMASWVDVYLLRVEGEDAGFKRCVGDGLIGDFEWPKNFHTFLS